MGSALPLSWTHLRERNRVVWICAESRVGGKHPGPFIRHGVSFMEGEISPCNQEENDLPGEH